ncbi:hypothetical protein A2U01_0082613, partial [Trifolium medium]|nr:hypothetical protein [Trifolium medium]
TAPLRVAGIPPGSPGIDYYGVGSTLVVSVPIL